jgi:hypothetical protein
MKKGIADVDTFWAPAVARYRKAILDSQRQLGLVGISDMALISSQDAMWSVHLGSNNSGMIAGNDFDMRNSINTTEAAETLAEGLALAEYTLKKGLATSLDLWAGQVSKFTFKGIGAVATQLETIPHDAHFMGAYPSLFFSTAYYRGLAAGLLELIDQLKATNVGGKTVWSETVIQLMSDFGRSPRSDGSGSDHGYKQMVTSVFSGAFTNGPVVVGNIAQQGYGTGSNYEGTVGLAAPISGYNQSGAPTPSAAASTVAAILRVPKNPYENIAAPLVKLNGDQLVPLFPGKIVA